MSNIFFNPHLEMMLFVTGIEERMQKDSEKSCQPSVQEILRVIKWLNSKCNETGNRIERLQCKKAELEKRQRNFLASPAVHETLARHLTLNEIALTVNSYDSLHRAGLSSVSELCELTEKELTKKYPQYITKSVLIEVKKKLGKYGLALKGDAPEFMDNVYKEDIGEDDLKTELERQLYELFGFIENDEGD